MRSKMTTIGLSKKFKFQNILARFNLFNFRNFAAQQELDTSHNQSGNTARQLNSSVDVAFDQNTGGEWIFPIGFEKREYQVNISQSCLFTNTLVCLPTGLGKTFIASVVIYNFYRWFPHCKIIFMVSSTISYCLQLLNNADILP